jgi:hypothetical protein
MSVLTTDQADILIAYMQVMEERTNHNTTTAALEGDGYNIDDLDKACRALGAIAGRDFSIY